MATYLIVGANSGIGLETTKQLSEHKIFALGRNSNNLNLLGHVIFNHVDITEENPSFPIIDEALDGIIYCPGTINLKSFKALKPTDFVDDFNTNVLGAVKTIKHYLPNLLKGINPSIILFSSVAANTGMAFHSSIATSKSAIEGLTKSLAAEFAPTIRVNAIAPSIVQTPLAEKFLNTESKVLASKERHPLKNIGSTTDITQAIHYLLNANWVTGQVLPIDGGLSTIK